MKKSLRPLLLLAIALPALLPLSGCDETPNGLAFADCTHSFQEEDPDPTPTRHSRIIWSEENLHCFEIDGHHYLASRCSGVHNAGVYTLTHSESCPCKAPIINP